MGIFSNISITRKLVVVQLFTATVVVILCSVVYLYFDYKTIKSEKEKSLKSIVHVMSNNFIAPMLFLDKPTGEEIIQDLRVKEDVLNATVMDADNNIFVEYHKEGIGKFVFPKSDAKAESLKYDNDKIFIYQPIFSEKEFIGSLRIRADFSDVQKQVFSRLRMMFYIVLIGGVISFLIAFIIQKYISKPINDLVGVMSDIMDKKNFSLRSELQSGDEIGKMSSVFNKLLSEVEENSRNLEDTNRILEHKVDLRTKELKDKNDKLVIAKLKEEESTKAKEQFMTSISHEIRTPLNAIIGFQELLRDTPLNEEQQEYLGAIDFAGKNLMVLINDILDISKIESGKFVFVDTEMNIHRVLKSIMDLMEFKAKENHIVLKYEIDEKIPKFIIGDQSRLTQVLINLLGNAVKFTERGFVGLKVSLIGEDADSIKCLFKIEDTGIGIPEDKLKFIFDRFTQVSAETNVKYGGTGLGLSIVKEIVELQGGRVYVESHMGVGSTFYVELGFKKSKSHDETIENKVVKNALLNKDHKSLHGLLADDVVMNQRLVKKIMEKQGHQVDIVGNGLQAIEQVKFKDYDFILMDVQMPDMDGHEATKLIREMAEPTKKNIPILGLTAHATATEREKCIQSGMNDVLFKPFSSQDLLMKINTLVYKDLIVQSKNGAVINSNKVFDLSELKERAEEDQDFLKEMFEEFNNVIPEKLIEIKNSIKKRSPEDLEKQIHKMKSILPTFGMQSSLDLLMKLAEHLKSKADEALLNSTMEQLESNFSETMNEVNKELEMLARHES